MGLSSYRPFAEKSLWQRPHLRSLKVGARTRTCLLFRAQGGRSDLIGRTSQNPPPLPEQVKTKKKTLATFLLATTSTTTSRLTPAPN